MLRSRGVIKCDCVDQRRDDVVPATISKHRAPSSQGKLEPCTCFNNGNADTW